MIETYPNAHLLGATATPIRSDDFNIRTHFFDSCEVSRYSLNNAIQDGTFVKPYYIYGTFLASENFLRLTNKVNESNIKSTLSKVWDLTCWDFSYKIPRLLKK